MNDGIRGIVGNFAHRHCLWNVKAKCCMSREPYRFSSTWQTLHRVKRAFEIFWNIVECVRLPPTTLFYNHSMRLPISFVFFLQIMEEKRHVFLFALAMCAFAKIIHNVILALPLVKSITTFHFCSEDLRIKKMMKNKMIPKIMLLQILRRKN